MKFSKSFRTAIILLKLVCGIQVETYIKAHNTLAIVGRDEGNVTIPQHDRYDN